VTGSSQLEQSPPSPNLVMKLPQSGQRWVPRRRSSHSGGEEHQLRSHLASPPLGQLLRQPAVAEVDFAYSWPDRLLEDPLPALGRAASVRCSQPPWSSVSPGRLRCPKSASR